MKKRYAVLATALCVAIKSHATTYYPAEILGRDLGIPGLGWAGHVGLTIAKQFSDKATDVIEVLNEIEVIQINTIEHFKKTTRYWGARYGIADQTPNALSIIKEALKQQALCPIYTDSTTYHPGEGTPDNPIRCAVFRCDTFINYLFHHAGYTLPTYHGTTLPRLVFKAFPKKHDDGVMHQKNSLDAFKKQFDVPLNQTTPAHLKATWELAKNKNLSHQKRLFLFDYLGLNGAPKLINNLIDTYKTETNAEIKSMLIRSTFTLYQTHFLGQPHPKLQLFYQSLLTTPLQTKDLPIVIRGFMLLSPKSTQLQFQSTINKLLETHQLPRNIQKQLPIP